MYTDCRGASPDVSRARTTGQQQCMKSQHQQHQQQQQQLHDYSFIPVIRSKDEKQETIVLNYVTVTWSAATSRTASSFEDNGRS